MATASSEHSKVQRRSLPPPLDATAPGTAPAPSGGVTAVRRSILSGLPSSPTAILKTLDDSQRATRERLVHLLPYLKKIAAFIDQLSPYVAFIVKECRIIWARLQPYHPEDYFPLFIGLLLMFFGGMYLTTVAAVEAYRIIGWQLTAKGIQTIYHNYEIAKEASHKDDAVDDDNDGIPDVKQISPDELLSRKMKLVLKSVDPVQLSQAFRGISTGLFAVAATLRVKFAQSVTLGASLGETIEKHTFAYLNPVVMSSVPKEYHRWIPIIYSYVALTIGVSIAWSVQRIISAFYTSIRGASIFSSTLLALSVKRGWVHQGVVKEGSLIFNSVSMALAAAGFIWQVKTGFRLFFPFNLILLPLTLFEYFFTVLINIIS